MATKDSGVEGDGVRLVRLLESRGLNKNRFAKKAGVSATAVNNWERALNTGKIGDEMKRSLIDSLTKVGIDPAELGPDYKARGRGKIAELLAPIMAVENDDILTLLKDLLNVESSYDREILLKLVEAKLEKRH